MSLSISAGGGGTQVGNQNPQSPVGSGLSTEGVSNVQSGTATDLLTTTSGIALHPSQLPTVNVNEASQSATNANSIAVTTVPPKHHINGGLIGISISLFVIAVIMFWVIKRSAKTTTNYK